MGFHGNTKDSKRLAAIRVKGSYHSNLFEVARIPWPVVQDPAQYETTGHLSKKTTDNFRKHSDDLKRAMNNMIINDPPLLADDNPLSHPTQVKWHVILGKDLDA